MRISLTQERCLGHNISPVPIPRVAYVWVDLRVEIQYRPAMHNVQRLSRANNRGDLPASVDKLLQSYIACTDPPPRSIALRRVMQAFYTYENARAGYTRHMRRAML